MAKGKTPSNSDKMQSARYVAENRAVKNRTRRLQKHIKQFPDDEQAKQALDRGLSYRRKAPKMKKHRPWASAENQVYAQQLASIGINGNKALAPRVWQIMK